MRFRQSGMQREREQGERDRDDGHRGRELGGRAGSRREVRELRRDDRGHRRHHAAAEAHRETFAGAAQVQRKHSRQVAAPETVLRADHQRHREHRVLEQVDVVHQRTQEHERIQAEADQHEGAQHRATSHQVDREHRKQEATEQRSGVDVQMHPAHPLLLLAARQLRHLRQAGHDARDVLEHAEGQRVTAGDHPRGDQRDPAQARGEQLGETRLSQRTGRTPRLPNRRFGQRVGGS